MSARGFGLEPRQRRVIEEQRRIGDAIQELAAFIAGEKFKDETPAEQRRLIRQLSAMEQLDHVLLERINAFGGAR